MALKLKLGSLLLLAVVLLGSAASYAQTDKKPQLPGEPPEPPFCYDCYRGPVRLLTGPLELGVQDPRYGALKGDKVYSIYIDTALGTVVMEYADPSSANHPYADDLGAPQPVRAHLPAHLKPSRLVISCVLDRSGSLKNLKVREQTGSSETTNQILAALSSWKFRPAFRGDQPVEVNAILGFDIDTR